MSMFEQEATFFRELSKPIILVGMPCSGKTSVGKKLGQSLKIPFVDADDRIVENEGMSIEDIFAKRKEEGFREAEMKAIKGLLSGGFSIVSTGGGAFTQKELQSLLNQEGLTVFLRTSKETILERYEEDTKKGAPVRPRLVESPRDSIEAMVEERTPEYLNAHVTVDTDGLSLEQVGNQVINALYRHFAL
ncbi:MAG: shikimate kinase [Pseudomonadota bacterium]